MWKRCSRTTSVPPCAVFSFRSGSSAWCEIARVGEREFGSVLRVQCVCVCVCVCVRACMCPCVCVCVCVSCNMSTKILLSVERSVHNKHWQNICVRLVKHVLQLQGCRHEKQGPRTDTLFLTASAHFREFTTFEVRWCRPVRTCLCVSVRPCTCVRAEGMLCVCVCACVLLGVCVRVRV